MEDQPENMISYIWLRQNNTFQMETFAELNLNSILARSADNYYYMGHLLCSELHMNR